MKTIAVLSRKGGVGKTTLTFCLAVSAKDTTIIDLDPQCSVSDWKDSREQGFPEVIAVPAARVRQTLDRLKSRYTFIDTPPSIGNAAELAAEVADFNLIVTRPGQLDLNAIGSSIGVAERVGKPYGLVVNFAHPSASLSDLLAGLEQTGCPVAPVVIRQRADFGVAASLGKGVTEVDPEGRAAAEIRQLWQWIEGLVNG